MSTTSETQSRITSVAEVKAALGDRLVDSFHKDDLWLRVRTDAWKSSMRTLRDTLGFHYFCFLSAIDWMPSPYGRGEDDPPNHLQSATPPFDRATPVGQLGCKCSLESRIRSRT